MISFPLLFLTLVWCQQGPLVNNLSFQGNIHTAQYPTITKSHSFFNCIDCVPVEKKFWEWEGSIWSMQKWLIHAAV